MAAGDITVKGPYTIDDSAAIDTGLTGSVVVADLIVPYVYLNKVFFVIVKAA